MTKLVCTKYGDWWIEDTQEPLPAELFNVLENMNLLNLQTKVTSSKRFLIYFFPQFIDIPKIIDTLKSFPTSEKTVRGLEKQGWIRTRNVYYGGYWAGNIYHLSVEKDKISVPYYMSENIRSGKMQKLISRYIEILEKYKDFFKQ